MYDEFSSGEGSVRSDEDEDMIDGTQESNSGGREFPDF